MRGEVAMPQRDDKTGAIKRLDACGRLRALRVRRWRISPPKRSFCGASLEYAVMHGDEAEAERLREEPYNPGLAGVFFKCGLIEAWGRGFDKITAGCKEYGGPRPSYKIGESGVMVLCKACPAYLELKNAGIEQQPRTTQTTTQSTTQTTAQKILAIIKANPNVSRSALSREIGLSSDGIKWHLQKLKEGNAIRRVGPKYGGHWEVVE